METQCTDRVMARSLLGVRMLCCMSGNGTPRAQGLGNELRAAREKAGIGVRELATRLNVPAGTVSRWETGQRTPSPKDVARYMSEIGAPAEQLAELVDLAHEPMGSAWVSIGIPEQRRQLGALLTLERTASCITAVSPLLIPGLLQTADYVRAMMIAGRVPAMEIDTRVAVRRGRRDSITRENPVKLVALIGEPALRQVIGDRKVMADQLRELLEMAKRPNIDLRIIPYGCGWHPALEGPFVLVEFHNRNPVVLVENRRSALFFHLADDVAVYQEAAQQVSEVAMSAEASTVLIAKTVTSLEKTRENSPRDPLA